MRKPPFRTSDPPRKMQAGSDRPVGWLKSIMGQAQDLANDIRGLELRISKQLCDGEPAAAVGQAVFQPDLNGTFTFNYLQDSAGASNVTSQYVLKDGVTYQIPIAFPPPGVFAARFVKVRMYQRLYVPGCGPMQVPVNVGDFAYRAVEEFQTRKFAFPDNANNTTRHYMRRCGFFWNLLDTKSGQRFSDEMLPDATLCPQGPGSPSAYTQTGSGAGGLAAYSSPDMLELGTPWLFERDGQAAFEFRPITPVIQPTATSGYTPYPFEDRESNNAVRNSAITVRVELHGTRYMTMRDAVRDGALVDGGAR